MKEHKEIEFLYLTKMDLINAGLNMCLALDAMEDALSLYTEGKTVMPYKTVLDLDERERGRINAMSAYIAGNYEVAGIKWIAGFPKNPIQHGLPRATALIILNDTFTGIPLAVMDSTQISAMRTGAVTGVGAKYLARKDSEVIAIIGAGVQARTQLEALFHVIPSLKKVKVFDIRPELSKHFCSEMSERFGIEHLPVKSPEEAVSGADIVVTVTVADEPIVEDRWLKKGVFFAAVGSYREEEDDVVLNADKIVLDGIEHVIHRETPIVAQLVSSGRLSKEDIYAEIGEIILGRKPGREHDSERIFYSPIGMAVDDIVLAKRTYDLAKKKGIGRILPLFGI